MLSFRSRIQKGRKRYMEIQVPVFSNLQVVLPTVRIAGGLDLSEEQNAVIRKSIPAAS